jgi:D-lactate dehydrogenase (cytochrome)
VPSASAAQITNMSRAATSTRFLRQQLQLRLECSRNGGALQQLNSRRCYASKAKPEVKEEKEEKESFKGQLYQSTAERLQRDKAEQARFAEHREAQRARSSPPWLVPFGMWSNQAIYV